MNYYELYRQFLNYAFIHSIYYYIGTSYKLYYYFLFFIISMCMVEAEGSNDRYRYDIFEIIN